MITPFKYIVNKIDVSEEEHTKTKKQSFIEMASRSLNDINVALENFSHCPENDEESKSKYINKILRSTGELESNVCFLASLNRATLMFAFGEHEDDYDY